MSSNDLTIIIIAIMVIGVIAFIVILNKQDNPKFDKREDEVRAERGIQALNIIRNAKNDKEFIKGMMKFSGNQKKNLFFKSVDACLNYMEKFFVNYPLENKHLYYGKIIKLDSKKNLAFIKVLCLIDGVTNYAMVTAVKSDELSNKKKKKDDFVYVGIEEVGTVIPYKLAFSPQNMKKLINSNNTKGNIVKRLTYELDVEKTQFIWES